MARYIDADALQRRICGAKCGCEHEECGCEGDCAFEHFIFNAPTANVAPRAEVAREIFEEIDNLFDKYPTLRNIGGTAIAELKNKYAGGGNDS